MNTIKNLSAMLKAFDAPEELPEAALDWAIGHWDVARPALMQVLARCARNAESADDGAMITAYFALFLMAEKRETAAMPLLRALMKAPDGLASVCADDGSMAVARLVIALFDGDDAALRAIAESPDIEPFIRESVYEALGYLVASGRGDGESTRLWLAAAPARFADAGFEGGDWIAWGFTAARLGFADLVATARDAFREFGEDDGGALTDLDETLRMAGEEPDPLAVFDREGIQPAGGAIAELRRIEDIADTLDGAAGEGEGEDGESGEYEPLEPAVNQFRDVGRNDPCPCGSGKKFKKCCLAA